MNGRHLQLCASAEWAETLGREIVPWVLAGRELGDEVLEVGPGPGLMTDLLRQRVPHLTAVEVDAELAATLRARLRGTTVEVIQADATTLPFEPGRFSAATCFTMLHHVPSPAAQDQLLAELRRVLRPGGLLVGTDSLDRPEWRELHLGDTCVPVDPATFAARLERAGFSQVEVESGPTRFRFAAVVA